MAPYRVVSSASGARKDSFSHSIAGSLSRTVVSMPASPSRTASARTRAGGAVVLASWTRVNGLVCSITRGPTRVDSTRMAPATTWPAGYRPRSSAMCSSPFSSGTTRPAPSAAAGTRSSACASEVALVASRHTSTGPVSRWCTGAGTARSPYWTLWTVSTGPGTVCGRPRNTTS